jgi:hypothetical protein
MLIMAVAFDVRALLTLIQSISAETTSKAESVITEVIFISIQFIDRE